MSLSAAKTGAFVVLFVNFDRVGWQGKYRGRTSTENTFEHR